MSLMKKTGREHIGGYRTALQSRHSTSFYLVSTFHVSIEALHWAQTEPDEVTAIIGLDMAVPEAYQAMEINPAQLRLISLPLPLVEPV